MNLKHMMYQMLPVHKIPPIGLHLRYLTHVMDLIHFIHQIHDATCASDVPVATRTTNMSEPGPPSLDRLERRENRSLNDTTLKQKVVFGQTGGGTSQAYPGN